MGFRLGKKKVKKARQPRFPPPNPTATLSSSWHTRTSHDVIEAFSTSPYNGLTDAQVEEGRRASGSNILDLKTELGFWTVFQHEVREPMILMLFFVGLLYAIVGEPTETAMIILIILIIVFAEVHTEWRAKAAMRALAHLAPKRAKVIRNEGTPMEVNISDIVPGDVIVLLPGDVVPADGRIVLSRSLAIDEAVLTGESVPAAKDANVVLEQNTPLIGLTNSVHAQTTVASGRGLAIVTATGRGTYVGSIGALTAAAKEPKTRLQRAMKELGKSLSLIAAAFALGVPAFVLAVQYANDAPGSNPVTWQEALLTGLALAFATIPEELPIIVTAVLALGSHGLAKSNVLIKRGRTAEALGDITTVVTDKTGTLTKNRLEFHQLAVAGMVFNARAWTVLEDEAAGASSSMASSELPGGVAALLETWVISSDWAEENPIPRSGQSSQVLGVRTQEFANLVSSAAPHDPQIAHAVQSAASRYDTATSGGTGKLGLARQTSATSLTTPAAFFHSMKNNVSRSSYRTPLLSEIPYGVDTPVERSRDASPSRPESMAADDAARAAGLGVTASAMDPFDLAVWDAAKAHPRAGVSVRNASEVVAVAPLVAEFGFTASRKASTKVRDLGSPAASSAAVAADLEWTGDGAAVAVTKGAPENVLAMCTTYLTPDGDLAVLTDPAREALTVTFSKLGDDGARVIALARRRLDSTDRATLPLSNPGSPRLGEDEGPTAVGAALAATVSGGASGVETDMTWVGLLAFRDPVRTGVKEAIAECQAAGIRVVMCTGDHASTAVAVAKRVNLYATHNVVAGSDIEGASPEKARELAASSDVVARASPGAKYALVEALQASGQRVLVTGDGVNDAPALAKADVGVALGLSGTDVAREAAGVILVDDAFATLALALREGRRMHANARKGISFYLAMKIALVLSFVVCSLLGLPWPFSPTVVIVMELLMDLGAALTFVGEPAEPDVMRRPPAPAGAPLIDGLAQAWMWSGGVSVGSSVLLSYLYGWVLGRDDGDVPDELSMARTMAFAAWIIGTTCLGMMFRTERTPLALGRGAPSQGVWSNGPMGTWVLGCWAVLIWSIFFSPLRSILGFHPLNSQAWAFVLAVTIPLTCWFEFVKFCLSRRKDSKESIP